MSQTTRPSQGTPVSLVFAAGAQTLAGGAAQESDAMALVGDQAAVDALLAVSVSVGVGVIADESELVIYLAPSADGSVWPTPATGSKAAVDLSGTPPLAGHKVGTIPIGSPNADYAAVFRTLLGYDGALALPPHLSIVVENRCGVPLTALAVTLTPVVMVSA